MAIRTKGRRPFDFHGRPFVWFIKDDLYLCVASADKRFSVRYELAGATPLLAVTGPEFVGVPASVPRPAWIVPPPFDRSALGPRLVGQLLRWCLDPFHVVEPYSGPRATTLQRAWNQAERIGQAAKRKL